MNQSKTLPYLLLVPATLFIVGVILYPIAYGVYLSITNQGLPGFPAQIVGLQNFKGLSEDQVFNKVVQNSVAWSAYTVVGVMVLGFGLALLLNHNFIGKTVVRGILLVPWTVPTTALAIMFMWLYEPLLGTVNQIWTSLGGQRMGMLADTSTALRWATVPVIWRFYPFVMLMLLAGLQAIDRELYEAAAVDGANTLQKFWHITLPLMRPILALVTILQFIWLFNHVDIIWVLTQGGPANATHIFSTYAFYHAYKRWNYGYASAIGVIMLVILLVSASLYLRLQRRAQIEL